MSWPVRITTLGPIAAGTVVFSERGTSYVTAIVKACFAMIHEGLAVQTAPTPIVVDDVLDPMAQTLARASEAAPFLPKTDVLVRGHARAPGGDGAPAIATRLVVADGNDLDEPRVLVDKTVHVYGARKSAADYPEDLVSCPLVYERSARAAGSPVGIEPPEPANLVLPGGKEGFAGFGPLAREWPARARLAAEASVRVDGHRIDLSDDFPFEFFQAAPPDQQMPHSHGGEWIIVDGMHPELPRFATKLPRARAEVQLYDEAGRPTAVELVCDTLAIDMDERVCTVVYRGHAPLPSERTEKLSMVATLEVMREEPSIDETPEVLTSDLRGPLIADNSIIDEPSEPRTRAWMGGAALENPDTPSITHDTGPPPVGPEGRGAMPFKATPAAPARRDEGLAPKGGLPFGSPDRQAREPDVDADDFQPTRSFDASAARTAERPSAPPAPEPTKRFATQPPPRFQEESTPEGTAAGLSHGLPFASAQGDVTPPKPATHPPAAVPPPALVPPAPVSKPGAPVAPPKLGLGLPPPPSTVSGAPAPMSIGGRMLAGGALGRTAPVAESTTPPADETTATGTEELVRPAAAHSATAERPSAPEKPAVRAADRAAGGPPREAAGAPSIDTAPTKDVPPKLADAPTDDGSVRSKVLVRIAKGEALYDANYAGADLSGVDFSRVALSGANLTGAKLERCKFDDARLTGAKLSGANLEGASFVGADLSQADLSKTTLAGATFEKAIMNDTNLALAEGSKASLRGASGQRTSFAEGRWREASFEGAELGFADFSRADVSACSFEKAKLTSARFADARGDGPDFTGADLDQSTFVGATMSSAKFEEAALGGSTWERATLEGCSFKSARLEKANLGRSSIKNASFVEASLEGASLVGVAGVALDFARAKLQGADVRQTKLADVGFEEADLRRVNGHKSVIANARFVKANLGAISMRGAKLKGALLEDTDVTDADFRDADLENAVLKKLVNRDSAKFGGAMLKGVTDDEPPSP